MNSLEIAQTYFDAWNQRDADGIVASMTPDGVYLDPTVPQGVSGQGIVEMVNALWSAFPDLHFELPSANVIGDDRVAAQWVMLGTNTGSFNGLPPTNKPIRLSGADFIEVADGKVKRVQGYFDSGELPKQLGLQIVVQPECVGPFQFGTSVRAWSGRKTKPGEMIITMLEALTPQDVQRVREMSRAIALDMLKMSGFISHCAFAVGQRMVTISAWEKPGDARQLMREGSALHLRASKQFYADPLATGAIMMWLKPERFLVAALDANGRMVRDGNGDGVSDSGEPMGETLAWW